MNSQKVLNMKPKNSDFKDDVDASGRLLLTKKFVSKNRWKERHYFLDRSRDFQFKTRMHTDAKWAHGEHAAFYPHGSFTEFLFQADKANFQHTVLVDEAG